MLLAPQGLLLYCRRLGVTARLKPLLWTAAVLYTFGLYSEVCERTICQPAVLLQMCSSAAQCSCCAYPDLRPCLRALLPRAPLPAAPTCPRPPTNGAPTITEIATCRCSSICTAWA